MCKRFPWLCGTLSDLCRTVTYFFRYLKLYLSFGGNLWKYPTLIPLFMFAANIARPKGAISAKDAQEKVVTWKNSRDLISVLTDSTVIILLLFFHVIITDSLICFFQEYLARLEAIRRQNFQERKEIQRRMAGVRAPVTPSAQVLRLLHHFVLFSPFSVPWKWTCWP